MQPSPSLVPVINVWPAASPWSEGKKYCSSIFYWAFSNFLYQLRIHVVLGAHVDTTEQKHWASWGVAISVKRVDKTINKNSDWWHGNSGRRKVLRCETYKKRKTEAADQLKRWFATKPRDVSLQTKPTLTVGDVVKIIPCISIGRMKTCVISRGTLIPLRDQLLRPETPGWHHRDTDGNSILKEELEWRQEKIFENSLVKQDKKRAFTDNLIVGQSDTSHPKLFSFVQSVLFERGSSWCQLPAREIWVQFFWMPAKWMWNLLGCNLKLCLVPETSLVK